MRRVALVIAAIGLVCGAALAARGPAPSGGRPVPTPGAQPAVPTADPATAPAAPAPAAAPARPSLEQLTAQAADLDRAIRKAVGIAERKRLTEELEKLKHQMGPYDANGQRVRCLAMWHDSAVESLEIDVKRLSNRPSSLGGGPAVALRLATRRMALACLSHGWRMPAGAVKYQVDAFGEYLANNARLLDPFYDAVGAWAGKDVKAADEGEDAAVLQNAAESVRQGIGRMGRAAETMGETASDQEAALVPLLGEYLAGLRAVCDAHDAVREALRRKGRPLPGPPLPAGAPAVAGEAAAPEDEPPPMTTEEQDRLAQVRAAAAKLTGAGWAPVVQSLERFAAVVEAGFQVVSARTKARELLASLARAAALAEKTVTSPGPSTATRRAGCPPAAYVKVRQMTLALALSEIQDPETRARGYVHVEALWQEDQLWRQLEALRLAPQACQGLMHGYYVTWYELRTQGTPEAIDQARAIRDAYRGLGPALQKMAPGQSNDLAPKLKECYDRQEAVIRGTLEAAGTAFATDSAAAVARLNQVGVQVGDLDLIVRADAVVKTVARYRPVRAPQMLTQMVRAAADLTAPGGPPVPAGAPPDAPRALLDSLVRPFEALSRFPLPEPDLMRAVQTLVGRAYGGATAALTQTVGAGIDAVSAGDPVPLRQALDAEHLFALLRRRAIAGTCHLDKAAVANLTAFSMPEKPWAAFVDAVDAQLRATVAAYAVQGPSRLPVSLAAPAEWDAVYAPVAAAQRLTVDARHPGETDLDLLMRNLEQTAVPPETAHGWWNWAVAYHATEAAVTANAGLDTVAAWHRTTLRSYDRLLLSVDLLPPKGR